MLSGGEGTGRSHVVQQTRWLVLHVVQCDWAQGIDSVEQTAQSFFALVTLVFSASS